MFSYCVYMHTLLLMPGTLHTSGSTVDHTPVDSTGLVAIIYGKQCAVAVIFEADDEAADVSSHKAGDALTPPPTMSRSASGSLLKSGGSRRGIAGTQNVKVIVSDVSFEYAEDAAKVSDIASLLCNWCVDLMSEV